MHFKSGNDGGQDSKSFLKLGDKETVRGVFRGEVHEFKTHWGQTRSEVCKGEGCPYCAKGDKASFRFRLNFIMKENGVYVPKIMEQGWTVYQSLKNLHESGFHLERTIVMITRYGKTKNDTTYQILPDPKNQYDAKLEQALSQVELLPVDPEAPVERAPAAVSDADEDMPF